MASDAVPPAWKILRLDGAPEVLFNAPVLGEFDAVIYDDTAAAFVPGLDAPPGRVIPVEPPAVVEVRRVTMQRRSELLGFLAHGGVLVVRLREPAALDAPKLDPVALYRGERDRVIFSEWWWGAIPATSSLKRQGMFFILAGHGTTTSVNEPDHALLEPYLRDAPYAAIVSTSLVSQGAGRRLASNRARDVVACEFDVSRGCVLLVPAEGDQELLGECMRNLLLVRRTESAQWRVREEVEMLDRYAAVTSALRQERDDLIDGLGRIWERKHAILTDPEMRRVLERYEKATSASTSTKDSLRTLYNMIEIVEARFGGEAKMISALGLSKSTVNALKRPANEERFDVRHSTVGEPDALDEGDVRPALEAAQTIVQALINNLYAHQTTP